MRAPGYIPGCVWVFFIYRFTHLTSFLLLFFYVCFCSVLCLLLHVPWIVHSWLSLPDCPFLIVHSWLSLRFVLMINYQTWPPWVIALNVVSPKKKLKKWSYYTLNFIWIVNLSTAYYIFFPKQSPILNTITFHTTFCINILSFVFYSQTTIVSGGCSFQQKYRIWINLGNKFHQLMSLFFLWKCLY